MNSALLNFDQQLFLLINQSLRNAWFDWLMPCLREKYFWIPLYVLIATYVIYAYRWKSVWVFFFTAVTVVLTDQLASSVIKPMVQRLRPCNDPSFSSQIHLLVDCGPGFSFVSSHAANHFGLALFLIVLFRKRLTWVAPVAILWAASVAYAQVYVGVHYPVDVLGGALVGAFVGYCTGRGCIFFLNRYKSGTE